MASLDCEQVQQWFEAYFLELDGDLNRTLDISVVFSRIARDSRLSGTPQCMRLSLDAQVWTLNFCVRY